ncbi:MAG: PHP domain-containing protein [Phycisphaeraceae bacterium]
MFCDLHAHTTASDGLTPPAELPQLAIDAGLQALAITDHDTTAGIPSARLIAKTLSLPLLTGIELSADPFSILDKHRTPYTNDTPKWGTLHILGYGIDDTNTNLQNVCDELSNARSERNPEIVEKLNTLGVKIDYQQVIEHAATTGSQVIGRPHIAAVLQQHGYVRSHHEAFKRYIGEGAPAYVRKDALSAQRAIQTIHDAGGLAILAHPVQLTRDRDLLARAVLQLRSLGIDGIETIHPDQKNTTRQGLAALAKKLNLLTTGGSDFHGKPHGAQLGAMRVPLTYHQTLTQRLNPPA